MPGVYNIPSEKEIDEFLASHRNRTVAAPILVEQASPNFVPDFNPDLFVAQPDPVIIGRLTYNESVLLIDKDVIVVGRNTSTNQVDFCIGSFTIVSRRHFRLEFQEGMWSISCESKNGIFINENFQKRSSTPRLLTEPSCWFRFPSTNISIWFENFVQSETMMARIPSPTMDLSTAPAYYLGSRTYAAFNAQTEAAIDEPDENEYEDSEYESDGDSEEDLSQYPSTSTPIPEHYDENSMKVEVTEYAFEEEPEEMSQEVVPWKGIEAQVCRKGQAKWTLNPIDKPKKILKVDKKISPKDPLKPGYSYSQLIVQSLYSTPAKRLTLSGIYAWISNNYEFYRNAPNVNWQNSIRHNLSLNKFFLKVARQPDEVGKGCFWQIDEAVEQTLFEHCYRMRRLYKQRTPFVPETQLQLCSKEVEVEEDDGEDLLPLDLSPPASFALDVSASESQLDVENTSDDPLTNSAPEPEYVHKLQRVKREREVDLYSSNSCDFPSGSDVIESDVKRRKTE